MAGAVWQDLLRGLAAEVQGYGHAQPSTQTGLQISFPLTAGRVLISRTHYFENFHKN